MPDPEENELKDELPQHQVKITEDFYIGQTEVTQAQWLAVMENRPGPEKFWRQANWETLSVVSVSWFMAQRFVEELNKMDKAFVYRLPTEAEWVYTTCSVMSGNGLVTGMLQILILKRLNPVLTPVGQALECLRCVEGAHIHCPIHLIRPAYRVANRPGAAYEVTGFRLVAKKN